MKHDIFVRNKEKIQKCPESKSLMDGLYVCEGLVPNACHNGACGLCRIKVHKGEFRVNKMNRKFISISDEWDNIFLACRVFPESDMEIELLPRIISKKSDTKTYVLGQKTEFIKGEK